MADVTIRSETIDWNGPEESGVELFIYPSKPLVTSGGVPVIASNPWEDRMRDRPWRKVACEINPATATLTIDALTISDTEDAIVGSDTTLIAVFMDTSYAIPRFICLFSVFGEGFTVPAEPSYTSWAAIAGTDGDVDESSLPLIIHDKFNSGTNNANRRPTFTRVGTLWAAGTGTFEVGGGYASPASGYPDGAHQLIETNRSNFTLAALLTGYHGVLAGTQSIPGLIARAVDGENCHVFGMDTSNHVTTAYEQEDGDFEEKESIDAAQESGAPIPITITAVDDVFDVHLAGQEPVQYVSELFMDATKVGIRAGKSTGTPINQCRIDDFAVIPAFERPSADPIIETVTATWEDGDVAAPCVFYDPELEKYVMAYSGFDTVDELWRVGLAYADTPLGPFTKEAANPVFEPIEADEGYIAASCSVVCDSDGVWWMVYQIAPDATAGDPAGVWRICAAKSLDKGLTWTRLNDGDPIIPLSAAGGFDRSQHDPELRIRDGKFEVAWSARNDAGIFTAAHSIGTDLEDMGAGSRFTIQGQFGADAGFNGVLNVAFGSADKLKYSTYFCHQFDSKRFIVRSDTEDGGKNWKYWGGVLFKRGAGWESVQVFDPALLPEGDKLYLYYAGSDGSGGTEGMNSKIGVAVLDLSPPSPPSSMLGPGQSPQFHF